MAWTEPKFSKQDINRAGRQLVKLLHKNMNLSDGEHYRSFIDAVDIIDNWRASHSFPLNTLQMNLRKSARRFDPGALVAQRVKRLVSITNKLHRFPNMKLTQIQDIGGCRAVLANGSLVKAVTDHYLHRTNMRHQRATCDDYISAPKISGYRGVHFVYRYRSDRSELYNDLKIELQLRSRYQHAWATAVETVGTFVQQALKSSIGQEDWLRFFALMGTAIAIREEQPAVPNTPSSNRALIEELQYFVDKLDVTNRLRGYGNALRAVSKESKKDTRYYLLQLDLNESQLTITGFSPSELKKAQEMYSDAERLVGNHEGTDAVLVSVDSLAALERAYPNYFADTNVFLALLEQTLAGSEKDIVAEPLKVES